MSKNTKPLMEDKTPDIKSIISYTILHYKQWKTA